MRATCAVLLHDLAIQVLNDVKARMANLMAEGSQLRALTNSKQRELDDFEADFKRTANQSQQVTATYRKLQAQMKETYVPSSFCSWSAAWVMLSGNTLLQLPSCQCRLHQQTIGWPGDNSYFMQGYQAPLQLTSTEVLELLACSLCAGTNLRSWTT